MATTKTHLVAVFDDFDTARSAQDELIQDGFAREDVQITGKDKPRVQTAAYGSSYSAEPEHEGSISRFFHRIFGSDDHGDRAHYTQAVSRGSAVLTVEADENDVEAATEILNRYNPVNLDEGADSHGSSAYNGGVASTGTAQTAGDRTIPVVQEEMQVGKRAVERGGVRVYSRVVEEPVQESVSLHEERARVERRPVDRPATEADFRMKDEVIEVIETGEEAVVGKTARVVEEVVVGKDATDRTQTVRDTVRRTDVQVEDLSPEIDDDFRKDYQTRYSAQSGADYNTYGPAYEYGYHMAGDPRYRGRNWSDVEGTLQSDYATSNPGSTWDKVSGAVRHGWDKVTGKN
jgi:uncharacterized protein (TIGR02271 family)